MELSQNLQVLAIQFANDIRAQMSAVGDLSQLSTEAKDDLVAALNELKVFAASYLDSIIFDAAQSPERAYSSNKIEDTIEAAIQLIKLGAPEAFDSLKEIADYIAYDKTQTAEIVQKLENSLRFDTAGILQSSYRDNVYNTLGFGTGLYESLDGYIAQRDSGIFTDYMVYPLSSEGYSRSFLLKNDKITMQDVYQSALKYGTASKQNDSTGISVSKNKDIIVSCDRYWRLYGFDGRVMTVAKKQSDGTWIENTNNLVGTPIHTRFSRVHNDILYITSQRAPLELCALRFNQQTNNFDKVGSIGTSGTATSRWSITESNDGKLIAILEKDAGTLKIYKVTVGETVTFELIKTAAMVGVSSAETHRPPKFSYDGRFIVGYAGTVSTGGLNRKLPILVNDKTATEMDFSNSFVHTTTIDAGVAKDFIHMFSDRNVCALQVGSTVRFYQIDIVDNSVTYTLVHTLTGLTKHVSGMSPDDRYIFLRDASQVTSDPIMEVWMRESPDSYNYQKIGEVDVGLRTTYSNGGIAYMDIVAA